jgi:L-amino acid N-acyltransferase YncA
MGSHPLLSGQTRGVIMFVRLVAATDAPALASLLDETIARGGTTAFQQPFTPRRLAESMLVGRGVICCFVAEESDGSLGGFQSLVRSEDLPNDVSDIATFSRVGQTQKGIGSQLFAATQTEARRQGLRAISATIRDDNVGGLAFYRGSASPITTSTARYRFSMEPRLIGSANATYWGPDPNRTGTRLHPDSQGSFWHWPVERRRSSERALGGGSRGPRKLSSAPPLSRLVGRRTT